MEDKENNNSFAVIQAIDEEIQKSKSKYKRNYDYQSNPDSIPSKPPKVALENLNREGRVLSVKFHDDKTSNSENCRYSSVPSRGILKSPQSESKEINFEKLKINQNIYNTQEPFETQPIKIGITSKNSKVMESIIDNLKHLRKQIDEDSELIKSKIIDIINSEDPDYD